MSSRNRFLMNMEIQLEFKKKSLSQTDLRKRDEQLITVSRLSPMLGSIATASVNVATSVNEQLDREPVTQITQKTALKRILSDSVLTKEIESDVLFDPDCSQSDEDLSLPIPDGMVVDPLTSTTLAVTTDLMDRFGSGLSILRDHGKKVQKYVWKNRKFDFLKKSGKSIVNIVLIDAKYVFDEPTNGPNGLYCKFKLGSEIHKTKQVSKSKPLWCERFNLYNYEENSLEVTLWQKGKQKIFIGRCVIDLSQIQKEKTQDLWQDLECGQGALHMLITVNGSTHNVSMDNIPTTNGVQHPDPPRNEFSWYRLNNDWNEVGQLSVTVYGAQGLSPLGLSGKADAYCVLELDNSRVQTHTVSGSSEPVWNKHYTFGVNDITSTLDIKINDESLIGETLGKISIPLLRIKNDEKRWYALKDKSRKSHAKGSYPRILLQMSVEWNLIKASLKVLSPKETKYTQKPPKKFNIPLIYHNLQFIKDIFQTVHAGNENLKYLFEWDSREKSAMALLVWLVFWFLFSMWMTPMLVVIPFIYYATGTRNNSNISVTTAYTTEDELSDDNLESNKDEQTIKSRLSGLQDLTFTIKDGIDYIVSLIERVKNLLNFTVPYLSYLAIAAMIALSAALYIVPINYIFMAVGIYKFTRKYLNPDRIPNNDILDFLSRVPDDKMLKQWQELKVPEHNSNGTGSYRNR